MLLGIEWLIAPDYATRVRLVFAALDYACSELVSTRHLKQELGEDALTSEIVSLMKAIGIDATHDTDVGGHVDILIRSRNNFLWVGEAKIHKSYKWLLDGFDQLSTRYSTGLPGQQDGGLVIYCFTKDASATMEEWATRLGCERPEVTVAPGNGLIRFSEHRHEGAGTPFSVRHNVVPMYWRPAKKTNRRRVPPALKNV